MTICLIYINIIGQQIILADMNHCLFKDITLSIKYLISSLLFPFSFFLSLFSLLLTPYTSAGFGFAQPPSLSASLLTPYSLLPTPYFIAPSLPRPLARSPHLSLSPLPIAPPLTKNLKPVHFLLNV